MTVVDTSQHTSPGRVGWADRSVVEFRALGPVEAEVAGRPIDLGAPKQRALLALLLSRVGQPVTVDVMLEALWAGRPPPSATTSLQAYVANLRRALEPDRAPRTPATVLHTCPGGYLLNGRVVDVDVLRFGDHATAGWQAWDRGDAPRALSEFEAGLSLWRGQAYAEVAGATCVAPEVARLEELRLSVVEVRGAALLAVGAHEVAVAELEAFVQAHPLREYGCELLSLALYRAGRQADALGVLRTTQRRLAEELGIDPRPALKTLEQEILNQVPSLDWQPPAPVVPESRGPERSEGAAGTPPSPHIRVAGPPATQTRAAAPSSPQGPPTSQPSPHLPSPPPTRRGSAASLSNVDGDIFVGRTDALRRLGEALAAAKAGRGRVVTVSGEPGIGKTSLLRRFAEVAGVPVLSATCPEHVAAPPLWLWGQVLRAAGACFPQRAVPPPVAELLHEATHEPVEGDGATLRRFEAIVRYLTGTEPVMVLLDNLHCADPASLCLLAHFAESVPASRLLLAVSYRSDEADALGRTLAALVRADLTRIELAGLDPGDTRLLATALLGHDVAATTAAALWERTEGNPFFLRELVKTDQRSVPVPVRQEVLRRIDRLPRAVAEVLSVAAVAGRHFDIEVVAEAAAVEIEAVLEVLDTAVAAALVVEDQQRLGWFRFTHALTAEALYETTGRLRRARLHRRIGAAAARAWAGNTERAAEVARHWLLAAELDPTAAAQAATHAAAAARAADERLAPQEAVPLWRQALTAAELAERERHPLLVGLGTSLCRAGDPHDGLPVFVQAMEEAFAADTSRFVTTAVGAMSELDSYPVDERVAGVLERALSRVTEPVPRALVLSCLAVARHHGDPARGAALTDEALAVARHTADDTALAHVLYLRAAALNGPDHLDQRLQALTELLALPGLPPVTAVRARQLRSHVLLTLGRVTEATEELDLAAPLVPERRSPVATRLAWSRAGLSLLGGRWHEADELGRAAHDRHARTGWGDARLPLLVQRWEAAYLAGRGADLVDDLRAAAESSGVPTPHALLATALAEAGRTADARATLRRFPRIPKDHLWLHTRCWALLAAARLGETELVRQWRAQLLPYRHLACALWGIAVSGSVAYFTAAAALALGDPDAALADLAIAADSTLRMGAKPWLARVREVVEKTERGKQKI